MRSLLILILLSPSLCLSQIFVNGVDINKKDIDYIQVIGASKFASTSTRILVDFGEEFRYSVRAKITDTKGEEKEFGTIIAALNFFTKNGWEFVSESRVSGSSAAYSYYLLRRKKE